jgi:hypothetical protein
VIEPFREFLEIPGDRDQATFGQQKRTPHLMVVGVFPKVRPAWDDEQGLPGGQSG